MNILEKDVQEPWFSFIAKGIKQIEGRLKKGSFENIKKNDIIIWKNGNKKIKTKIISIHNHKLFENMLKQHSLKKTLPNIKTINDGVNIYRQFYTKKDEEKYGVIAIKIKRIKK